MKTVDVSQKPETFRSAVAYGMIRLRAETIKAEMEALTAVSVALLTIYDKGAL